MKHVFVKLRNLFPSRRHRRCCWQRPKAKKRKRGCEDCCCILNALLTKSIARVSFVFNSYFICL